MSMLPTDEELLSCPEAVELSFIHRGRRDMIAPQAGKELLGRGFFNFSYSSNLVSCYIF